FEPMVTAVEAFGPRVEVARPGTCLLPTRGPARYFGGEEALAGQVAAAVSCAVAGLLGPSWTASSDALVNPYLGVGIADGRFAATQAAAMGTVVAPGQSAPFLADFPVAVLERPDLCDLLARLGIRRLSQLAALPAADVLARFGADGALA